MVYSSMQVVVLLVSTSCHWEKKNSNVEAHKQVRNTMELHTVESLIFIFMEPVKMPSESFE